MEGDASRDANKSIWVLGRSGDIAEDWKSLEQSSILWVPTYAPVVEWYTHWPQKSGLEIKI